MEPPMSYICPKCDAPVSRADLHYDRKTWKWICLEPPPEPVTGEELRAMAEKEVEDVS